jgi:hypothetical protein
VFDTAAARVVRTLPVGANVRFAAGMTKLVLADPDAGQFTRYDLATLAKEQTARFPFDGTLRAVTMGAASGGPLVASYMRAAAGRGRAAVAAIDLPTFQEVDPGPENGNAPIGLNRSPMEFRSSPDGRVVTAYGGGEPVWHVYQLSEAGVTARRQIDPGTVVVPADDGTVLASTGLYTPDLLALAPKDRLPSLRVPAQQGPTYLVLSPVRDADAFPRPLPNQNEPTRVTVALHVLGSGRPLLTLPDPGVRLPLNLMWNRVPVVGLAADRRVLFSPAAKLIGFIPEADDTLVLHRFDLDAELARSGADYLFAAGPRPPAAVRGRVFKYVLDVESKAGGVAAKLDTGPAAMKVSGTTLTWEVPLAGPSSMRVVVKLTDAAGRQATHSFTLSVKEE